MHVALHVGGGKPARLIQTRVDPRRDAQRFLDRSLPVDALDRAGFARDVVAEDKPAARARIDSDRRLPALVADLERLGSALLLRLALALLAAHWYPAGTCWAHSSAKRSGQSGFLSKELAC